MSARLLLEAQFEIFSHLLTPAFGQAFNREGIGWLGALRGHFLLDRLSHVALDVRPIDESAISCRAFARLLTHLRVARAGGAAVFRSWSNARALAHSHAGLAIQLHAVAVGEHVALALLAAFAVAVFAHHGVLGHFHVGERG